MKDLRILVVRGGAIGDFIMTLPAIGALRERWPEAHIEILGYPHIIELAQGRYYADATRSIEAKPMAGFFVPNGILEPTLMDYFGSFNLVISYLFDPDSIFANNIRRCGVKQLIEGSPRPRELHAAEHYCKPLESLAIYVDAPRPRLYVGESDRAAAAGFLKMAGREPIVAVHPGSGSEKKNWPIEKFAAVARWVMDELAAQLIVVAGEADERAVEKFAGLLESRKFRLARGLKLVELAAVLERCALFLGNDSGITHLAAAVGTPTVALFGAASPSIWEPRSWRSGVHVVRFSEHDVVEVHQAIGQLWGAAAP
ncbi:MAG TPA: glycosyltransferase family 9 protein [Verrucomicrobiae bacterium]|nr:glycosyltransferase family 9 protein [Verrucomicrobiae bacterium]